MNRKKNWALKSAGSLHGEGHVNLAFVSNDQPGIWLAPIRRQIRVDFNCHDDGAALRRAPSRGQPPIMAAARAFLARISVHQWDEGAAEAHARIRVSAKRLGRSAGAFDIMIAAHAEALGVTLVTSDVAVKNLKIEGLRIVSW